MKQHSETAAALFTDGCNCCQAVFGAFAKDCGLDMQTALKIASSFGGGMGRLRETCGAVTGMFMVAGILAGYSDTQDKQAKDCHYKLIQELASEFTQIYGTYNCNELLGNIGKGTYISAPRTPQYYKTRPCVNFVITAADILDKHFFDI